MPHWRSVCANFVPVADMHQRLDANAFHLRTSPWPRMTVQRSPQWPFLPSVESSKMAAPSNRRQKAAHVGTNRQEQQAHHARLEAHRAPTAPGIASRPAARRQKRTLASRCSCRRRNQIVASRLRRRRTAQRLSASHRADGERRRRITVPPYRRRRSPVVRADPR